MRRKLLVGSVISGVFLYLALRDIQWSTLWDSLGRTRYEALIPAVLFSMLGHYARAYRWRLLLLPVKAIPTPSLFSATMIGLMANNLLPARLGELVRAHVVGKQEQISRSASFATIVYERALDMFALLVLLWITFLTISAPQWLRTSGLAILILNVVLFAAMLVLEKYREQSSRLVAKAIRRLPGGLQEKILHATSSFLAGFGAVSKVEMLIPIALTTAVVWFFALLAFYFCLLALDMNVPISASLPIIVFVSVGSMIPSAPAYLGTTQYACIVALALYGVGKSEALAYSFLYHATQFFPITLVGFYFLGRAQMRLGELSRSR